MERSVSRDFLHAEMLLNKLWRGSVALVVTTMFLSVSRAGERADYIPACPTEVIKAWNTWDPTDLAKMPPLPESGDCINSAI